MLRPVDSCDTFPGPQEKYESDALIVSSDVIIYVKSEVFYSSRTKRSLVIALAFVRVLQEQS